MSTDVDFQSQQLVGDQSPRTMTPLHVLAYIGFKLADIHKSV